MLKRYLKRMLSMLLIATLLIQILPATAKGAEIPATVEEESVVETQTGISDMYEYLTLEAGKAGTIKINLYTGKLYIARTDMELNGERMPIKAAFYYDETMEVSSNPYGEGWMNIYNQQLVYGDNQYKYKNENGTWIYFVNSGNENENGEEIWVEDTLYDSTDNGRILYRSKEAELDDYTQASISRPDGEYFFDDKGRLIRIEDEYDFINIGYADDNYKIDYIEDSVGRKLVFFYSGKLLIGLYALNDENETIENTQVTYRRNYYNLTGAIYGRSVSSTYGYSDDHMNSIADIDRCGYEIVYDSDKRVTAVVQKADMGLETEESGEVISINYSETVETTVTTENSREIYTFDRYGRVTRSELQNRAENPNEGYITVSEYEMSYEDDPDEEEEEGEEQNGITGPTLNGDTSQVGQIEEEGTLTDNYGNIISEYHRVGWTEQTTRYAYDSSGNHLISVTDADGFTESYDYGEYSDDVIEIIDRNGNKTQYSYNGLRELSLATMEVTGLKQIDKSTGKVQVVDGAEEISVGYEYEAGRLTSIHYGDSIYVITYDKWGNILTVSLDGNTLVTYDYGTEAYKGLVQTLTYGNGNSVYYTYNHLGQVSTLGYVQNTPRYEYSYTSKGEVSTIYDVELGMVTEYTEDGYKVYNGNPENLLELRYEYKSEEENYTETILGQVFQYTIENDNDLSWLNVMDSTGAQIYSEKTQNDKFDRLEEKTVTVDGLSISQKYNYIVEDRRTGNRVSDYTISYNQGDSQKNLIYTYTYDGNGNILRQDETDASISYRTDYVYDEAGQLKEVRDQKAGIRYSYSYDVCGNMVSKEIYSINEDGTETLQDQIILEYTGTVLTKSYSTLNGTVQYKADKGNNTVLIAANRKYTRFIWEEGRRLVTMNDEIHGVSAAYSYNEEGLRVKKVLKNKTTTTTTEYIWGKNGLAGFTTGTDTVVIHYGEDGRPVGFSLNDTIYTYVKNIQGDVLRILDTEGDTLVEYSYDPWGVPTVTGNTELADINPCSYRCYDYDEESGLYYLQSRYYNPENGRWLNSDEVTYLGASRTNLGYNLFAYCENNPVNNIDPDGHLVITTTMLICAGIGALVLGTIGGFAGYYISKKMNVPKGSRWKYVVGGALIGAVVGAAAGFGLGYCIGGGSVVAVVGKSGTAISTKALKLGNKLRYVFGKATGSAHNIKRSKSMYSLLKKIGIWDNKFGNEYLTKCIIEIYKNATPYVSKGKLVREAMLYGPGGGVMLQTIWEGTKLITVYIFG